MDFAIREGLDSNILLREWRWFIPTATEVVLVSPLGDMVVVIDGKYWFLDATRLLLEQIACGQQELTEVLNERGDDLLGTSVVRELLAQGFVLPPGKCISFYPPIRFGGKYKAENARAIDATEYIGFLGNLNWQVKDL